jgi:hypothetical protein
VEFLFRLLSLVCQGFRIGFFALVQKCGDTFLCAHQIGDSFPNVTLVISGKISQAPIRFFIKKHLASHHIARISRPHLPTLRPGIHPNLLRPHAILNQQILPGTGAFKLVSNRSESRR